MLFRDSEKQGGRNEVTAMAWPLAVGMISFTLMGVTDTLIMGHVGTVAQAAVGLGATFVWTFMAFFRGTASGAQTLVAAADGAGDRDRVVRAGGAGVLMGLVSGVIAAGLLAVATAHALPLMVDDPKMVASATRYLDIRVWGLPLTLTAFGLMSGLQGLGDSKARMQASVAGNAVNIGLDIVLVFGLGPFPRMEEAGAALATVIGAFVMLMVYAWRYRRLFGMPRLPGAEVLRSALTVGLPAGSQALIETIAFATMNIVLARVGPVHLAASGIVLNIVSVSFLPGYALAEAGAILVGRYVGAGSGDAAKRSLRTSRSLALAFMGVCGLLFALCGAEIASMFTRDQEVVALAAQLMLVAAAFQVFDAVAMVHLSVLRAVGDTRYTLLVTSLASWTLLVPAVFALGIWAGWGAVGAWLGLLAEIAFLAAITAWRVPGIYDGRVVQMELLLGRGS